jgi:SAM-dependent methyltransferase
VHETEPTSPDDDYRTRAYANWEAAAPGWDRERAYMAESLAAVTTWMLDALPLEPGTTVLELAAGPGDVGLEAAGRVAPDGRAIVSDRSPAMVAAIDRRAAELGVRNAEARVIDIEAIDLPDETIDAALCRLGLMLVPDRQRALREIRRVLRPGGRLAAVVWASPEENAWATRLWDAIEQVTELPPAAPGGPGMFALGDRAQLIGLVEGAGLELVEIAEFDVAFENPDFDDLWRVQTTLNGALVRLLPQLDDAHRERLRDAVRAAVEPFRAGAGYRAPGRALGIVAAR